MTGYSECMVRRFAASEMRGCQKLVCANVYGLCWSESLLARMECAALSSPLVIQSRERLLPVTGLESAGFHRCAISSFASRPAKKPQSPQLSLGCGYIGQHGRPIWFILREYGPGHAGEFIR